MFSCLPAQRREQPVSRLANTNLTEGPRRNINAKGMFRQHQAYSSFLHGDEIAVTDRRWKEEEEEEV